MTKSILNLIPRAARNKLNSLLEKAFKENRAVISDQIPKYELREEHISNLKVILNREELLRVLPKNGVVAELGVNQGEFSEKILDICTPKKLYLIDFWGSVRYDQDKRKILENKLSAQIASELVEISLGKSTEISSNFKDGEFDWIYIDTDHSYQTTIGELECYKKKVRENGIIAGHDYITGNWDGMVRYGVIEAVYEFCVKYNWEIIYLTMENKDHPSFAIRKISTSLV